MFACPKKIFLLSLLSFLALLSPRLCLAQNPEVRAAWLNANAFSTSSARTKTLQSFLNGNLNTAFLIAYPLAGNNGWSTQSSFEEMLRLFNQNNISTHVWVASRYRLSGRVDYTSAAEPAAQAAWALAFLDKYNNPNGLHLDGFHLDYIRYEKYETSTSTGSYADLPRVDSVKTEGINKTVKAIYTAIKNKYPAKKLTASVREISDGISLSGGPYPSGCANDGNPGDCFWYPRSLPYFRQDQQNSFAWLDGGYIDAVVRMNYATSNDLWNFEVDQWKLNRPHDYSSKVIMGLGWLEEGSKEWYDAAATATKVSYGRNQGFTGFAIFEIGKSGIDDSPLTNTLATGPFSQKTSSWLAAGSNISPPSCQNADLDGNSKVNGLDLNLFQASPDDLNQDNQTNSQDLVFLLGCFLKDF